MVVIGLTALAAFFATNDPQELPEPLVAVHVGPPHGLPPSPTPMNHPIATDEPSVTNMVSANWVVLWDRAYMLNNLSVDDRDPWRQVSPKGDLRDEVPTSPPQASSATAVYNEEEPVLCGVKALRASFIEGSTITIRAETAPSGAVRLTLVGAVARETMNLFSTIAAIGAPSSPPPGLRSASLVVGTLRVIVNSHSSRQGCLLSADARTVSESAGPMGTTVRVVWETSVPPRDCFQRSAATAAVVRLDLRWVAGTPLVPMWTWDQPAKGTPETDRLAMCHSLRSLTPGCPHVFGLPLVFESIPIPPVADIFVNGNEHLHWGRVKGMLSGSYPNLMDAAHMNYLNGSHWALRGAIPGSAAAIDARGFVPFISSREASWALLRHMHPLAVGEVCPLLNTEIVDKPPPINVYRNVVIVGDSMMVEHFYALQQVLRPNLKVPPSGKPSSFEVPLEVRFQSNASGQSSQPPDCIISHPVPLHMHHLGFEFPSPSVGQVVVIPRCSLLSAKRSCTGLWSVRLILRVVFRRAYTTKGTNLAILNDAQVLLLVLKQAPHMIVANFAALHWMKNGRSLEDWATHLRALKEGLLRHNADAALRRNEEHNATSLPVKGKDRWKSFSVPLDRVWLVGPTPRFTNPYRSMHQQRILAFWAAQLEVFGGVSSGAAIEYITRPHQPFNPAFAPRAVMPWGVALGRQEATRDGQHLACHQQYGGVAATIVQLWLHAVDAARSL